MCLFLMCLSYKASETWSKSTWTLFMTFTGAFESSMTKFTVTAWKTPAGVLLKMSPFVSNFIYVCK